MAWLTFLVCLFVASVVVPPAPAQVETELLARARVFPDIGAGVRAVKHGPGDRYYVLTAPGAVVIFDRAGTRVAQVPASASPSKEASLVYGDDLDVDAAGRIYVADRAANAIKVYDPSGALALQILIPAPTSVLALPAAGEIAVASMKTPQLVTVFDTRGRVVREFGQPTEITERKDLNRFLNIGRLARDPAGHIYYAFSYLPEPTVREYDPHGYAVLEIELTALEFQPAAQAARREIERQERGGPPTLKPIITAVAVDQATKEVWAALGGLLLHFDREGNRRGTYRTFTPEGARLEATAIMVEPERLLLAADPLGIYEFPHPGRPGAVQVNER